MIGRKFGVCDLGQEVINYISHATKQRLQNLLEKVSEVAQQKNLTFKVLFSSWTQCPSVNHLFYPILFSLFFLLARWYFSVHQEDERFEQVTDVRTQLKFFEQLDQMEKQRKEEQEREILMKAAKVTLDRCGPKNTNNPHCVMIVLMVSFQF